MLALALFAIVYCTCPKARAIKVLTPTWFGMESIAARVYVDKAMPVEQREHVLKMVEESKSQLANYYGDVSTTPKLLFLSSESGFRSFGGTGETGMSFFGYASLFSPRGLSSPIVAHEWSHVELYSRLGFRNWRRVPQWFDEGLAVTVSEEPRHSESVYEEALQAGATSPALSELESLRQWNEAIKKYRDPKLNHGNRAIVYATAGHEVRKWFQQAGRPGLQEFFKEMRSGAGFSAAYSRAELK